MNAKLKHAWLVCSGQYVYYNSAGVPMLLPQINAKDKDLANSFGLALDETEHDGYITCWNSNVVEYEEITAPLFRIAQRGNTFRYECIGEHTQQCPSPLMIVVANSKATDFHEWRRAQCR